MSIFSDIKEVYARFNPCAVIIDCRSKAITEQQEEINRWLRDFSNDAAYMLTLGTDSSYIDARIITVGSTIEVGGSFRNAGEGFPELQLKHGTGASLEEAVEIALDRLEKRTKQYRWEGLRYNKPKLYILSADIIHYCASIAEPENRLHRMICDRKIKFYPMICLPKFLLGENGGHLRDACLPTLQASLDLSMFEAEDHQYVPSPFPENKDGIPPVPTEITIGI